MTSSPTPAPGFGPFEGRYVLQDRRSALHTVEQQILPALEQQAFDKAGCFAVRLALEEAITNAFTHGNANDPSKSVTLEYQISDEQIVLEITDEGAGFDPDAVPDPTESENIEIPSGRGIVLMRAYMNEVSFKSPGNTVRMTYARRAE